MIGMGSEVRLKSDVDHPKTFLKKGLTGYVVRINTSYREGLVVRLYIRFRYGELASETIALWLLSEDIEEV